jgi:two-component system chemotaxis response regulator CheB
MPSSQINTHSVVSRPALFPEQPFDLVVIAASAGGVTALRSILAALPADFPTPIAIVLHLSSNVPSGLPKLWGQRSRLTVQFAGHGDRLRRGKVFVAPPSLHLLVSPNHRLELANLVKVNYVRPAADVLFESAAAALGSRVLAMVLTGMGRDGAAGASAIKAHGGTVIVQDPADAEAWPMPRATIDRVNVDLVLPLRAMSHALIAMTMNPGTRDLFSTNEQRRYA